MRCRPVVLAVLLVLAEPAVRAGGAAAEPAAAGGGAAVTMAQLAAMPTSPKFSMDLRRGKTGAPEATAIGATPIEPHASAAAPAAPAPSAPAQAKDEAAGHAAKVQAPAEKGGKPGHGAVAATGAASADGSADPLERLRQRLAEKLGAQADRNAAGRYVMRVSNRSEPSGEAVLAAVRPTAGQVAAVRARAAGQGTQPGGGHDAHGAPLPAHWDYAGPGGPQAWAALDPANAACASGQRQSPIDIRGGIAVDLEPIRLDYQPRGFTVTDTGRTVQVAVDPGNAITVTGKRYELVSIDFHRPAEERVGGRQFDMGIHLVHKAADGRLAVIAVLLDRGEAQPQVQAIWNDLPLEKGDPVRGGTTLDLARLLPDDRRYYTYMGSLTAPPCSEGVLWMVMQQPLGISPEQLGVFARLYPMNARPLQQADGRLIKQSN